MKYVNKYFSLSYGSKEFAQGHAQIDWRLECDKCGARWHRKESAECPKCYPEEVGK